MTRITIMLIQVCMFIAIVRVQGQSISESPTMDDHGYDQLTPASQKVGLTGRLNGVQLHFQRMNFSMKIVKLENEVLMNRFSIKDESLFDIACLIGDGVNKSNCLPEVSINGFSFDPTLLTPPAHMTSLGVQSNSSVNQNLLPPSYFILSK